MMFRTHLIFSFLIGLLVLKFLNFGNVYLFLLAVLIGGMLPDIDKSNSKIGRKTKPISVFVEMFTSHRGFFHSLFPLAIIYLVFNYLLKLNYMGYGLIIGYLGHLIIDAINYGGIKFFYPLSNFKINGFIKTNSVTEYILFFVLFVLSVLEIKKFF